MCAARSRPFFLSLGTTNGERVPVEINGAPVEFDSPGFKGRLGFELCYAWYAHRSQSGLVTAIQSSHAPSPSRARQVFSMSSTTQGMSLEM